MSTVYLNGDYIPDDQAVVSPLDRGFMFADGVYEVIPAYGGRLFRLQEHLERLRQSLDGIRITPPYTDQQWAEILHELIERNDRGNQSLYLQITRGVALRDHAFPRAASPTVFAMCSPLTPMSQEVRENGVAAVILKDIRWEYCHLKTIALLPNILLRQQALDAGASEAILVRDGEITEGAASNLFIVDSGVLKTPPKGPRLLPGITRDLVMELAAAYDIPHQEAHMTPNDLRRAQEIWVTSSTKEILPVTRLDNAAVGNGRPGPVWTRMIALYQDYKQNFQERAEGTYG